MLYRYQKLLANYRHRFILINRNYTLLWLGSNISLIGDILFDTVLTLWIGTQLRNQSYAPLAISGIALAAALPALVVSPFAGVFVDRWQKHRTMRIMDMLRTVLVLSLLLISVPLPFLSLSALPFTLKLGVIYGVIVALSSLSQFFNPSAKAIIREIVPEEKRTRAFALTLGASMFAWAIGSSFAGIGYAILGFSWAIVLNAASFLCSWALIRKIRISEPVMEANIQEAGLYRVFKDLQEGLRFIAGSLVLRTLLCTESLFSFALGMLNVLAFFFITQNLHLPISLFGLFCAAPSLGGILGSWLVDRYAAKVGVARVYYCAMICAGIIMEVTAVQSHPLPALIGFTLMNVAYSHTGSALGPLVLKATPEKMAGRVFSTIGTVTTVSSLLGTFLSGYLSSTLLHDIDISLYAVRLNGVNIIDLCVGLILFVSGVYAYWHLRKMS
ncbi:permease [Reticulibacter mediterranei]|uniref:Permease n=1 Tax=Reticulibacter mediterranei TaxID=2778369 RepID=A0A8J3IM78_9CHLR|nr:MFS transporter [Reticulibacter mediterranei]GHO97136.1 permease [Reticulibacter mediterranei]